MLTTGKVSFNAGSGDKQGPIGVAAAVAIGFQSMLGAAVLALTMILLLVTGIHNAWDLVVWLAQQRGK